LNLFELFVKIGVDDQASGKLKDLGSKLGNGLKTAAKIGTAAVGAAAAGITALTTAAVNNYAEYEQLVGGVETLFKDSADAVKKYADEAYRAAGLSANEYMSTVTGFSASLLQSLGRGAQIDIDALKENLDEQYDATKKSWQDRIKLAKSQKQDNIAELQSQMDAELKALKKSNEQKLEEAEAANNKSVVTAETQALAADLANQAVIDMADNAAKMGTDMSLIQNAYAGFAKQNYTMLDNLKLGYGGTQSEMERLIKDAAALDSSIDANSLSFDNIVKAINVVQTEMGITGTTALEAGRTISGSIDSMKASWTNLLTGLANGNADIEQLVNNLVTSIVGDGTESNLGVLGNIMPAVKSALSGASKLVSELLPAIVQEIPAIISENLPILAEAAVSIIQALIDGVSQNSEVFINAILGVFETIIAQLPSIIASLSEFLPKLVDNILAALPGMIDAIVSALTDGNVIENLIGAVVGIVQAIADNLPKIIQSLVDAIPRITESVNNAILENFPALLDAVIQIVMTLIENLPTIIQMLVDQIGPIVSTIVQVIVENLPAFIQGIVQIVIGIVKAIPSILASVAEAIWNIFAGIGKGLANAWPKFKEGIAEIWDKVVQWFSGLWDKAKEIGGNIISGIKEGIKKAWNNLKEWFSGLFDDIIGIAKKILGIASPSKVFKKIGGFTAEGFGIGFDDEFAHVKDDMEDSLNFDDASFGINASIRKVGAGAAGGAYGGTSIGSITINIDGANYEDEQSLAESVAFEIKKMIELREVALYA
jgi:phage-related protein